MTNQSFSQQSIVMFSFLKNVANKHVNMKYVSESSIVNNL